MPRFTAAAVALVVALASAACAATGPHGEEEEPARVGGPPSTRLLAPRAGREPRVVSSRLEWTHEGDTLVGELFVDATVEGPRPGVLVIPEWWGLGDHARERAARLAAEGFAALACDMYGGGMLTESRDEAGRLAGRFRGTPLLRTRARAGLDALAAQPSVDPTRLAAIGFCFGGTASLELAWSGAPLRSAVSFHGSVTSPAAGESSNVKARILVLHGADDPLVPAEAIRAFETAAREGGLDWTFVNYGGAVHSFTNPGVDRHGMAAARYHAAADRRAWAACVEFLRETLE
jgi:dienelactone hydrolase